MASNKLRNVWQDAAGTIPFVGRSTTTQTGNDQVIYPIQEISGRNTNNSNFTRQYIKVNSDGMCFEVGSWTVSGASVTLFPEG